MIGRGHLGIKSGQGFYEWDADSAAVLRRRISCALASIGQFSD
jgi:3-hydroxyacyl-CoA dehydrogenase